MNQSDLQSSIRIDKKQPRWGLYLMATITLCLIWFSLHGWAQSRGWVKISQIYPELTYNNITPLAIDPQGRLWLNTSDELVSVDEAGNVRAFLKDDNNINDLAFDSQGRVWIARHYGGLTVLNADGTMKTYTSDNSGLMSNLVWSVAVDTQGRVWAGTLEGLDRLAVDGKWRSFLPYQNVQSIAIDAQDVVWAGTHGNGLHAIHPDGYWKVYTSHNSGLTDDIVLKVAVDEQERVWAGAGYYWRADISVLTSEGEWQHYLEGKRVEALGTDNQGNLWVGTDTGLSVFSREGNWKHYNPINSGIPRGWIEKLVIDRNGRVWFKQIQSMVFDPAESISPVWVVGLLILANVSLAAVVILTAIMIAAGRSAKREKAAREKAEQATPLAAGMEVLPVTPAETSGQEKARFWKLFAVGFLGWYVIIGGIWLLIARNGVDFESSGLINLLLWPLTIIALIVFAVKRPTRAVALGLLAALALNLQISLILGLGSNAGCFIPFFVEV